MARLCVLLHSVSLALVITACQNDETQEKQYQVSVPAEFKQHVDNFEIQAGNFGVTVEINNLVIQADTGLPPFVRGRSQTLEGQHFISLNTSNPCWQGAAKPGIEVLRYREMLVFHELAHLFLKRHHTDGYDPVTGRPLSLMSSDLECYQGSFYIYDIQLRPFYLKELFTGQINLALLDG